MTNPVLSFFSYYVDCKAVIFYFLLAGYFSKSCSSLLNIKRAWMILLPLAIYCVAGSLFAEFIRCLLAHSFQSFDWSVVCNAMGDVRTNSTPGNPYLWFLKVLCVFVLVSPLFMRIRTEFLVLWCAGVYLAQFCLNGIPGVPYFIQSLISPNCSFFVLGIILRRFVTIKALSWFIDRVCVYVVLTLVGLQTLKLLNLTTISWKHEPWIEACLSCVYFFSLAKLLQKLLPRISNVIARYGQFTFFLYVTHWFFLESCWTYFELHPVNKHFYALVPIVFVLGAIVLGSMIRKHLPHLSPYLLLLPRKS